MAQRWWAVLLLGTGLASPFAATAQEARGEPAYRQTVLPLLQKYCADCHQRDTSEGRWAFDSYAAYRDLLADQTAWRKAEQLLAHQLMPPREAAAPLPAERELMRRWIDESVFYVDPHRPDPGRPLLRRMNRAEYNNSIRDVFGLDLRPADQFPPDDAGYGFDNIADVLSLSPLLLEKYLAAARQVAAEVTRLDAPPLLGAELSAKELTVFQGRPELLEKLLVLHARDDQVGIVLTVPEANLYRVAVRAAVGEDPRQGRGRLEVLLDDQQLAVLQPAAIWKGQPGPIAYVAQMVRLPAGEHRLTLRTFAADDEVSDAPASPQPELTAAVGFLGVTGPFAPSAPQATEYLRRASAGQPLGLPALQLSGEDLDVGSERTSLDTGRAWFAAHGYRQTMLMLPAGGEYRVRFKVGAQQAGPDPVRFEVRLADRTLGPFTVTATAQTEQWIETRCELPAGELDWQVWFLNAYTDPQSGAERWLWLHEFTIEGPLDVACGLSRGEVLGLLQQTGRRLFRRPLSDGEFGKLQHLVDEGLAAGNTPQEMLPWALEALLVSPRFLFHPRPQPAGDEQQGTVLIDELTLASRLAGFLWSSLPDEELLALAEQGRLRNRFSAQVQRMIQDPKGAALTSNFAGQWLQLRDLEGIAPDARMFPEFDAELAADMRRESELLFEHILRQNRPVREFLDADYSFLNERLARHYELPPPAGGGFQRVSLHGTRRRGVVTHASILTLTSHPTRTAPVNRGKWLLEQLLGSSPPPAPRDVPPLPEAREDEGLPLRARLEQHRANAACAACHAVLDPPGFALENFDAIGRWRETDAGQRIDASSQWVTGEKFADWSELSRWLVDHRAEDFRRSLTEHLLTYALGREITYHDKHVVRSIMERSRPPRDGFLDLVLAVCESLPFQRMRVPAAPP